MRRAGQFEMSLELLEALLRLPAEPVLIAPKWEVDADGEERFVEWGK